MPRQHCGQHDKAEQVQNLPALPMKPLLVPASHQDRNGDILGVEELLHEDPNYKGCHLHRSEYDTSRYGDMAGVTGVISFNTGSC